MYILERPAVGPSKRLSASEVSNFMNTANIKTQLANQLKIESVLPKIGLTPEQIKHYLDHPPAGMSYVSLNFSYLSSVYLLDLRFISLLGIFHLYVFVL